jgi:hypothetical protein
MKRILRRVLIVVSGTVLALGTAGVGPAHAANYEGGIDVPRACRDAYGSTFTAKPIGPTAYDWRCVNDQGDVRGIDMPQACRHQQGIGIYVVDRIANFNDVNSWQCWKVQPGGQPIGGLDLPAYCRSIGYPKGAKTIGTTAYDWRCVNAGGELGGINTTKACQKAYGGTAVDRFRNFYDAYSWECYI